MKKKIGLSSQILIGLALGALVGYLFPDFGDKLKPFGDAFLRMIKMIVVPLIFSTLVMGIAGSTASMTSKAARSLFSVPWSWVLPVRAILKSSAA